MVAVRQKLYGAVESDYAFLYALLAAAFLHNLTIFLLYIDGPLTDMHGFRQTQTALTAFWLPEHWAIFNYQTPVLGAPWSIPFEFPLYQILAALLHKAGMPLAVAGRCVSWGAMLAVLFPAQRILLRLFGSNKQFLFFAPLYLASPIYVFWGRTFMIETFSLLLFSLFLYASLEYAARGKTSALVGAGVFGCLGLLVKVTTAPPFYFVAALLFARKVRVTGSRAALRRAAAWACVLAGTVIVLAAWVVYSDSLKMENPFGESLTSLALREWNFGTFDQRSHWAPFLAFLSRVAGDVFGYCGIFILMLFFYPLLKSETRTSVFISFILFSLPITIFYNLHLIHGYYQTPIAIFLILCASLVLSGLSELGYTRYGNFLCALLLVVMVISFHRSKFDPVLKNPNRSKVVVGEYIKDKTPQDSSVVVFGTDWSSEICYYSERKGIAFPTWAFDRAGTVVSDIDSHLGGLPLGAVVLCPNTTDNAWLPFARALIAKMRHPTTVSIGECQVAVEDADAVKP